MEYKTQESLEEYKKKLRELGYLTPKVTSAACPNQPERLNPETSKEDAIV